MFVTAFAKRDIVAWASTVNFPLANAYPVLTTALCERIVPQVYRCV